MDVNALLEAHRLAAVDRDAAEALARRLVEAAPDEPFGLHLLGVLVLRGNRAPDAVPLLRRAADRRPDEPETRVVLAEALMQAGDPAGAVAELRRVVLARPSLHGAWSALAIALLRAGDAGAALDAAERATALAPESVTSLLARGTALAALKRPAEALEPLRRAALADPEHAMAHLNLGNTLLDLDDEAAALRHMERAAALDPGCADTQASLGFLLAGIDRFDEAIAACDAAIRLRPGFAQAYWNRSFAELRSGDFAQGWEDHEWRRHHPGLGRPLDLPGPEWDGAPLAGQRLLVHATQGLGDTIQLARYVPLLAARAARIVLACDRRLISLLAQLPAEIVARGGALPEYDVWVDQMSLPRLFGTRPDTIPSPEGYLKAEPATLPGGGVRVGVVCAGNPAHSNDARRSMRPSDMARLRDVPGVSWTSLQVGPDAAGLARVLGIADRSAELGDFGATARLVAGLDLVVAVDTSTAHLAGALGVPVWVLLPRAPDWRWAAGEHAPWYASARVIRQDRAGDWAPVIARVAAGLARLTA